MTYTTRFFLPLLLGLLLVTGCDSSDALDDAVPLEVTMVADLAADPAVRDPNTGQTNQTGRYLLYSLRDNRVVLRSDDTNRADSASAAWDIGFQSTNIIFNGGDNGPGEGGAILIEDVLEGVTEAPATGYEAAPSGGFGWYNYDQATHIVSPIPGRTFAVRTADGRYAKLRILSYYEGAPGTPDANNSSRYYTFEYVFQEDGSRNLASE